MPMLSRLASKQRSCVSFCEQAIFKQYTYACTRRWPFPKNVCLQTFILQASVVLIQSICRSHSLEQQPTNIPPTNIQHVHQHNSSKSSAAPITKNDCPLIATSSLEDCLMSHELAEQSLSISSANTQAGISSYTAFVLMQVCPP